MSRADGAQLLLGSCCLFSCPPTSFKGPPLQLPGPAGSVGWAQGAPVIKNKAEATRCSGCAGKERSVHLK